MKKIIITSCMLFFLMPSEAQLAGKVLQLIDSTLYQCYGVDTTIFNIDGSVNFVGGCVQEPVSEQSWAELMNISLPVHSTMFYEKQPYIATQIYLSKGTGGGGYWNLTGTVLCGPPIKTNNVFTGCVNSNSYLCSCKLDNVVPYMTAVCLD